MAHAASKTVEQSDAVLCVAVAHRTGAGSGRDSDGAVRPRARVELHRGIRQREAHIDRCHTHPQHGSAHVTLDAAVAIVVAIVLVIVAAASIANLAPAWAISRRGDENTPTARGVTVITAKGIAERSEQVGEVDGFEARAILICQENMGAAAARAPAPAPPHRWRLRCRLGPCLCRDARYRWRRGAGRGGRAGGGRRGRGGAAAGGAAAAGGGARHLAAGGAPSSVSATHVGTIFSIVYSSSRPEATTTRPASHGRIASPSGGRWRRRRRRGAMRRRRTRP